MIFVPALVQTVVPGSDAFLDHYQVSVSCRCWYYAMTRLSAAPFPPCPWIYRAQVYDAANYSLCARQSLSGTCESHTWELIFLMNERFYLASTDNVFFFFLLSTIECSSRVSYLNQEILVSMIRLIDCTYHRRDIV